MTGSAERQGNGGADRTVSRRGLLAMSSLVGAAAAATVGAGAATAAAGESARDRGERRIPFDGARQAGILAPYAAHGWFAAFDVEPGLRAAGLTSLLRAWTDAARRLTAGRPAPGDDAMATGYGPASLTVTVGFGASLLRHLGAPVPAALAPLPSFPRDEIDQARSGGDLGVLFTADDAIVVAHALRTFTRLARGAARVRWQMSGFSTSDGVVTGRDATPRNLMGQLDGSGNPRPGDTGFDQKIFVGPSGDPAWMRGGSYLVFRRIRMLLDEWDTLTRSRQEQIVGRRKDTGAPLSGGTEFTPLDLGRQNADGSLAIGASAHVRQAAPETNDGAVILRKGFSYFDGVLPDGSPDAGLLFLAFQADPAAGFTRIQQRLALADDLSRFIRHTSSALFAVPRGCRPGRHLGQDLLESL
ncbi:Dyp-type peroxidase [Actinoallomurus soli]|uniref:Dyp-type peroxidase n=1 Tax=Actinoallomurus soli TaxID=2952535 RepID=UPI0020933A08|nr:Dyp-type peroxidase [Actinoallomurus soli]MCO5968381.1 Dyp-type peroxidase [Actinoallomurus soli]